MTDEGLDDDSARKHHLAFSVKTWRWIFATLGCVVLGLGLFAFGPEESVKYSAALAGAGLMLGVLVPLLLGEKIDSRVAQWGLLLIALLALTLLVVGSTNVRLPDVKQAAYIAMGAAILSAFGGAAAGRLCEQETDAPECEEAPPFPPHSSSRS